MTFKPQKLFTVRGNSVYQLQLQESELLSGRNHLQLQAENGEEVKILNSRLISKNQKRG